MGSGRFVSGGSAEYGLIGIHGSLKQDRREMIGIIRIGDYRALGHIYRAIPGKIKDRTGLIKNIAFFFREAIVDFKCFCPPSPSKNCST